MIVTDTAQPSVTGNTVSNNGRGGLLYKQQTRLARTSRQTDAAFSEPAKSARA
ncbi:hypothetical protein [Deinococcus sp.]|uniref:hypothetical protein n=1 Tax=Deinococcus sp. TaxID=47478 RepID=UPI003CC54405